MDRDMLSMGSSGDGGLSGSLVSCWSSLGNSVEFYDSTPSLDHSAPSQSVGLEEHQV